MSWFNERCHLGPPGNVNRWRCKSCGLIKFYCLDCHQYKTIPDEWERRASVTTLNARSRARGLDGWICDMCHFAYLERTKKQPVDELNIMAKRIPQPIIMY